MAGIQRDVLVQDFLAGNDTITPVFEKQIAAAERMGMTLGKANAIGVKSIKGVIQQSDLLGKTFEASFQHILSLPH